MPKWNTKSSGAEVSGTSKPRAKRQLLERTSAAADLRYGTQQQIVEVLMNVSGVRSIARGVCVVSFVVFLGTNGTDVIAQQASPSIRQQAHEAGGFERIVVTTYDPLRLSSLVGRADLIVEASTAVGRSYLNTAETDIFTDYTFTSPARGQRGFAASAQTRHRHEMRAIAPIHVPHAHEPHVRASLTSAVACGQRAGSFACHTAPRDAVELAVHEG